MKPSERLSALQMTLPPVAAPVGSYVPALKTGHQVLTSGQLPMRDGKLVATGKVGRDLSVEDAQAASGLAALNALAAASAVCGGVDKVARIVRVCVFVNSAPGFTDQPRVANGASDFLAGVFGEAGRHVRAAVGVAELPLDAAVEIELTVEIAN